jgi:hypothetical protein
MMDLIVSVADSYQEQVMNALLPRVPRVSGTRPFSFQVIRNIENDSGSYTASHEFLRDYINQYSFALVLMDFEGTGVEHIKTRNEIETDVEHLLNINGWQDRNCVAVIEPEIENWIWVDSPHMQRAMGWDKAESLYNWARQNGKIQVDRTKPNRPKETFQEALRIIQTPTSSSIYKDIADHVTYRRCTDEAFIKVIDHLKAWFPVQNN